MRTSNIVGVGDARLFPRTPYTFIDDLAGFDNRLGTWPTAAHARKPPGLDLFIGQEHGKIAKHKPDAKGNQGGKNMQDGFHERCTSQMRSGQQVELIQSGFGKWMNTIIIVPENWFIFLNKWWNFRRGRFAQAIRGYPACFLQPATTPLTKPGLVLRSRLEDGDPVLISAILGDIARAKGMLNQ